MSAIAPSPAFLAEIDSMISIAVTPAPSLDTLCALEDVRALAWSIGLSADVVEAIAVVRYLATTHGAC